MEAKTQNEESKAKVTILETGYDPKNRPVLISKRVSGKSSTYRVSKPDTGFCSKPYKSQDACKADFEFQISCSQN